MAGSNFRLRRPLVKPALAARFELEVLHCIRHIDGFARDAGILERARQQAASGPDERTSRDIFPVARLLSNQHDRGRRRSLAEYGLRGLPPQWTGAAPLCPSAQPLERGFCRGRPT
jgi:hypothetical protein